jgi:DNA invertase Pin-like site-specific DNA recombinase
MYYFYSRISSASQNATRQQVNFFKAFPEFDAKTLYVDKVQGNVAFLQRPEASKLFDAVTNDSTDKKTVVVDSIDRLGRDLIDILSTIELFTKNGISLKSLKEGFETLLDNGKENPMAKMVVSVMGSIAEMERNRIKDRVAEGVQIARSLGKYQGRKIGSTISDAQLLERHQNIVKKLKKELSVREVADIVDCSTTTVMKIKKILDKQNKVTKI